MKSMIFGIIRKPMEPPFYLGANHLDILVVNSIPETVDKLIRSRIGSNSIYKKVRKELNKKMSEADILCIARQIHEPLPMTAGFALYRKMETNGMNVLYNDAVFVRKELQKQGIFRQMTALMLASGKFDFFAAATKHPAVYKVIRSVAGETYPSSGDQRCAHKIAESIADMAGIRDFEKETFIARGFSRGYEDTAAGGDKFFRKMNLNLGKDDSVLVIGNVKKKQLCDICEYDCSPPW